MDSKKVLLSLLVACIVAMLALFAGQFSKMASPLGLQVIAAPLDLATGEAAYAIEFSVLVYLFFAAIIVLLILLGISYKKILRSKGKGK